MFKTKSVLCFTIIVFANIKEYDFVKNKDEEVTLTRQTDKNVSEGLKGQSNKNVTDSPSVHSRFFDIGNLFGQIFPGSNRGNQGSGYPSWQNNNQGDLGTSNYPYTYDQGYNPNQPGNVYGNQGNYPSQPSDPYNQGSYSNQPDNPPDYQGYPNQQNGQLDNQVNYPNQPSWSINNQGNIPNEQSGFDNQGNYPENGGQYPGQDTTLQGQGFDNQGFDRRPNQNPTQGGYEDNENGYGPGSQGADGTLDGIFAQNGNRRNPKYPINNGYEGGPYPEEDIYPTNNNYPGRNRPPINQIQNPDFGTNQMPPNDNQFNGKKPQRPRYPDDIDDASQFPNNNRPAILGKPVIVPSGKKPSDQIIFENSGESPAQRRCTQDCSSTSEYEPVCGTNNVTYYNWGKFECARNCGVKVYFQKRGKCSTNPQDPIIG